MICKIAQLLGDKMVRYTGPKNRIARRFGANIFEKARNPMLHKPNPPGVHGAKRKKKSDYGLQLDEQQKLKASTECLPAVSSSATTRKQFAQKGIPLSLFIARLECRLDNVVYKLNHVLHNFCSPAACVARPRSSRRKKRSTAAPSL